MEVTKINGGNGNVEGRNTKGGRSWNRRGGGNTHRMEKGRGGDP